MARTVCMILGGKELKLLKEDYRLLISHHQEVLEITFGMAFRQKEKSPSGACYSFPGQGRIAEWMGRCRKTINETVKFYREKGFLTTKWREPRDGHFRTLLYFPGPIILKAMGCAMSAAQALLLRVTSGLHVSSTKTKDILQSSENKDFSIKLKDPPLIYTFEEVCKRHPQILEEGKNHG